MTTHLWLVIDHNPDPDQRRPRELVICGEGTRPNDLVSVSDAWAENVYIGEHPKFEPVYPWTDTDTGLEQIQQPGYDEVDAAIDWAEIEREQRRKRGGPDAD